MDMDIVERLRAALKQPGFTKKGLAAKAGLHPNTLLGCEGADWNPTLNTLKAIAPHVPPLSGAENEKAAA